MKAASLWRLGVVCGLAFLSVAAATPAYGRRQTANPQPKLRELQAPAAAAGLRITFLYRTDLASATAYKAFLEAYGHGVTLAAIASDGAATIAPAATDVFMMGADTIAGSEWAGTVAVSSAIVASSKFVVGLGDGGRAFFARARLSIGTPNRAQARARLVTVADYPTSRMAYESPNDLGASAGAQVLLYSTGVPVVAIPLADRLPDGNRFASLSIGFGYLPSMRHRSAASVELAAAPASPEALSPSMPSASSGPGFFPIVQESGRYMLWGFDGAPPVMTAAGQQLFLNLLAWQTQALNLPLLAHTLAPGAGIDPGFIAALNATGLPNLHAFAQVDHPLTPAGRNALEAKGVRLLDYLIGVNYTAVVSKSLAANAADPAVVSLLRAVFSISPSDKQEPAVAAGAFAPWADNGDGTVDLVVRFFSDVPEAESNAILAGLATSYTLADANQYNIVIAKGNIATLAQNDRVQWIHQAPPPPQLTNDVARKDLKVDAAQQAITSTTSAFYAGLDGSGITVAVMDSGVFSATKTSHPDLAGRVIRTAHDGNPVGSGGHGTHVAGIVAGGGNDSVANCPPGYGTCTAFQMRGMAPNARIAAFGASGDYMPDYKEAYVDYGAKHSTHSYAWTCMNYIAAMANIDRLIRGNATSGGTTIPPRSFTGSSGNEGDSAQYCPNNIGYFSLGNVSKNAIIVGSVDRGSGGALSGYSSRGPTWDQRIKPDVMATGCMWSIDIKSDGYSFKCATSMATPATAGVAALLHEQYQHTFGSATTPLPSTIKALLIGTATDLVHATAAPGDFNDPDLCPGGGSGSPTCAVLYYGGPDYSTGYGLVNAKLATDYMKARNFVEGTVSPAQATRNYTMSVSGQSALKFTLAWDDEPGDPSIAQTAAKLVNDLDLTVIAPNGAIYYPWVLAPLPTNAALSGRDPITQSNVTPAFRGVDRVNNVEQVVVTATGTLTPGVWTVRVNAFNLPNGSTQSFSLAGDFRSLYIVDPVEGAATDAGDPNAPSQVIVRLGARSSAWLGTVALSGVSQDDFDLTVKSSTGATTDADVLSGLEVGEQFWLVVKPDPVAAAGYYTLAVTWKGHGTASEKRSLLFLENAPKDRVVVVDHSGSMSEYDKMQAAQNAARLFIDLSGANDSIGVVAFETTASIPFSLTTVASGASVLDHAKNAVSSLTPANTTAMGQGLIKGQDELERLHRADAEWHIILLTDGMENETPYWADASVSGRINPTKTIIDTVAVGPPQAGQHALLASIASATNGRSYHVTESAGGALAEGAPAGSQAPELLSDFPLTLPNKLADVYKSIDEDITRQQRLWEKRDLANCNVLREKGAAYFVTVENDLPLAVFSLNFADAVFTPILELYAPSDLSKPVVPSADVIRRTDDTHDTWTVTKPESGVWKLVVRIGTDGHCVQGGEYMLWVSARTPINLQLFFGGDPKDYCPTEPVPILAFLADSKPIPAPQAAVTVSVLGPSLELGTNALVLYDDGNHGDGRTQDGIYGNLYAGARSAGVYSVKATAKGTATSGESFERRRTGSFVVRPCVAYVYRTDTRSASSYQALLQDNGFAARLIHTGEVTATNWSKYNLLVVGVDSGTGYHWFGGLAGARRVAEYSVPVIGNGEGGASFFQQLGLNINWGGAAVNYSSSAAEVLNAAHPAWTAPYLVPIVRGQVRTYASPGAAVETYGPSSVMILRIGRDPASPAYYPIAQQTDAKGLPQPYLLWGWYRSPDFMTTQGRWVYVNLAWYMKR